MRITIEPRDRSIFIQAIQYQRQHEGPRTGLHCSTIVHDIARRQFPHLFRSEGIDEATRLTFQELGNVIEDVIAQGFVKRIPSWHKPVPFTYRGVTCSPDGWSPRVRCVDEIKVLWKSENSATDGPFVYYEGMDRSAPLLVSGSGEVLEESPKFVVYKMQVLFYMAAAQAEFSRLHCLFINGNYRPPFPDPITMRLRPTRAEVRTVEEQILQHAQDQGWLR